MVVGTFYLPDLWSQWLACGLFILAGITDWLDGHFARLWAQRRIDFLLAQEGSLERIFSGATFAEDAECRCRPRWTT